MPNKKIRSIHVDNDAGVVSVERSEDVTVAGATSTVAMTEDFFIVAHKATATGGHADIEGTFPAGTKFDVDYGGTAHAVITVPPNTRYSAIDVAAQIAGEITGGVELTISAVETATDLTHAGVDVTGATIASITVSNDTETPVPADVKTILAGI